jgi:hypothetical protein
MSGTNDESLSHLDERLAAEFAQVGWRPAEHVSPAAGESAPETAASRLVSLLGDLAARLDALDRRVDDRGDLVVAAFEDGWTKVSARLDDLEAALVPARMAAETTLARLAKATDALEAGGEPMSEVVAGLQGVQSMLRAQRRVLEAIVDTLQAPAGEQRSSAIEADLAALREHDAELTARLHELEQRVGGEGAI